MNCSSTQALAPRLATGVLKQAHNTRLMASSVRQQVIILGFNDLKVIEVAQLIDAHFNNGSCFSDFREALDVQTTIEAIQLSARSGNWTPV